MSSAETEKKSIEALERARSGSNSSDSRKRVAGANVAPHDARANLLWSRVRARYQNFFSEFFGVFILILFGCGSVAQVVLSKGANGGYQSITWGWG
jgi:hypothetical protein